MLAIITSGCVYMYVMDVYVFVIFNHLLRGDQELTSSHWCFSWSSHEAEPQLRLVCEWIIQEWTWKKRESIQIFAIELAIAWGEWFSNPQDFLRSLSECYQDRFPEPHPRNGRGNHISVSLWLLLSNVAPSSMNSPVLLSWAIISMWWLLQESLIVVKEAPRQKSEVWCTRVQVQGQAHQLFYAKLRDDWDKL